jgi:hypothetical protein
MESIDRDANCNPRAIGIPAVVQVIAAIAVIDVNIVSLVPGVSPVFRISINKSEPIAIVLEAWEPAHHQERKAVDAEPVIPAIVATEIIVGNAVAVVAAALLPSAVLGLKAASAMLLPSVLLFAFLCMPLLLRPLYLLCGSGPLLLLLSVLLLLLCRLCLLLWLLSVLWLLLCRLGLLLRLLSVLWLLLCRLGLLLRLLSVLRLLLCRLGLLLLLLSVLWLLLCGLGPLLLLVLLPCGFGLLFRLALLFTLLFPAKSSGAREHKQQKCCTDNSNSFHGFYLRYNWKEDKAGSNHQSKEGPVEWMALRVFSRVPV